MGLHNAATLHQAAARSAGTDAKYNRSWTRWQRFLESVELGDDTFLDSITARLRPSIFVCFAQAFRDGEFARGDKTDLAGKTVREAMDQVAKIFIAFNRPHPFKTASDRLDYEINLLLEGHKNNDPPEKHEVAITPNFLRQTHNRASSKKERHSAILLIVAFFYAMRSCECLVTSGSKITVNIRLRHVVFLNGRGGTIHQRSPAIHSAHSTSLIFENQKNKVKWDKSTMESTADPLLNPTRALASIVDELWKDPRTTEDTPICTFYEDGTAKFVTANDMLRFMRRTADAIGQDKLGFSSTEIGTHSVRSGAAMAMFLDNTPIFLIMLVGRWSSDAFLKYIRKQVLETAKGISSRMLKNDFFHVLPSPSSTIDDPRTRNRESFATNLSSMALTSSRQQAMRPAFSLHH